MQYANLFSFFFFFWYLHDCEGNTCIHLVPRHEKVHICTIKTIKFRIFALRLIQKPKKDCRDSPKRPKKKKSPCYDISQTIIRCLSSPSTCCCPSLTRDTTVGSPHISPSTIIAPTPIPPPIPAPWRVCLHLHPGFRANVWFL